VRWTTLSLVLLCSAVLVHLILCKNDIYFYVNVLNLVSIEIWFSHILELYELHIVNNNLLEMENVFCFYRDKILCLETKLFKFKDG
jgi:hypothetical protein